MLNVISLLCFSVCAGILYRMGGSKDYNTKFRDFGVPFVSCVYLWVTAGLGHWSLILCFGLMFASLTTYFKPKGKPAKFWNWALVGLAFGLSAFPLLIGFPLLWRLVVRTVALIVAVAVWSDNIDCDVLEEFGRGFLFTASLIALGWH